jgi:hypothetical protein
MSTNRIRVDDLTLLQRTVDMAYAAEIAAGVPVPKAYRSPRDEPVVFLCTANTMQILVIGGEEYRIELSALGHAPHEITPSAARTLAKHLAKAAIMVDINEAGKDGGE